MASLPIACTLPTDALAQRSRLLQENLGRAVIEVRELENGNAYRFPGTSEWIEKIAQFIAFERECCRFLEMRLVTEPADGPVWLELRGPDGTKEFLQQVFART